MAIPPQFGTKPLEFSSRAYAEKKLNAETYRTHLMMWLARQTPQVLEVIAKTVLKLDVEHAANIIQHGPVVLRWRVTTTKRGATQFEVKDTQWTESQWEVMGRMEFNYLKKVCERFPNLFVFTKEG